IVAFDLYWLGKALRMSTYLIRGYRRLNATIAINWTERLQWLDDPAPYITIAERRRRDYLRRYPQASRRFQWNAAGIKRHRHYQELLGELAALTDIQRRHAAIIDPRSLYHLAIVATYNESREILEPTVLSMLESTCPASQIMLIIAYEERGGEEIAQTAKDLVAKYGHKFAYAEAVMHPDGIVGEVKGKGGNITYAGRHATAYIESQGIDTERVIVTTFDADNRPDTQYFTYLSYTYAIDPNRIHKSYQPVPMYHNNIWDAPAPMRVIATSGSFWQLMEMMRPHRLRNFSSHAQPLRALIDTDFWSVTSPNEDGHQFWRSYFAFNGDYAVVPLYMPVYQDAVLAETYPKTFVAQYKQLRRWAYGVSDFPYVVRNDIRNKEIPLGSKLIQTWRLFEGHVSWATATLIITFVAWLPLYLNQRFSNQELAHQLPIIASHMQSIALIGLFITISISMISLPPRPTRYSRRRNLIMVVQWVLLPVTGIFFNSITALDAQTRLMLGRYLGFYVTVKSRRS
ncbi:MAG TPA: hypothetical protein VMR75_04055, partial [Candidatus Saccharimonadales bacterium]|nr:hypothetical protein [Candidatus Saccharimonadales bacterium]